MCCRLIINLSDVNRWHFEAPVDDGDYMKILRDGVYEISASFIFHAVDGDRVWANLIRRNRKGRSIVNQDENGKTNVS